MAQDVTSIKQWATVVKNGNWLLTIIVVFNKASFVHSGRIVQEETASINYNYVYQATRVDDIFVQQNPMAYGQSQGDLKPANNIDPELIRQRIISNPNERYQDMDIRIEDSFEMKGENTSHDQEIHSNNFNNNKNKIICTQENLPSFNLTGPPCGTQTNGSNVFGQQRYSKLYNTVASTLSATIFVFGLLGNILVIIVISRTRSMHTTTNCYLLSLSVADSLVLLSGTLPAIPETFFRVDEWPYGRVMCSMLIFLQYLGVDSSSLSITAFTIERYIAICHPMRAHSMCTVSRAKKIIAVLWGFTILYCSPWLGLTEVKVYNIPGQEPMSRCQHRLARSSYLLLYMIDLIVFYVIPLIVAIILYLLIGRILFFSRSMRKNIQFTGSGTPRKVSQQRTDSRVQVVRMLVVVVVLFATLWMPYRVIVVYNSFAKHKYMDLWFLLFARTMVYINCAINPILYNIMSVKFKRAFRNYLSCWHRRERHPPSSYNEMNTDVWATRRNTNANNIRQHQQLELQQQCQKHKDNEIRSFNGNSSKNTKQGSTKSEQHSRLITNHVSNAAPNSSKNDSIKDHSEDSVYVHHQSPVLQDNRSSAYLATTTAALIEDTI